jgi:hypothetical protein
VKKPSPSAIRAALPLTSIAVSKVTDRLFVCGVCGVAVDPDDLPLTVWREHDEHDRPIPGNQAIVFLGPGSAHAACRKALDGHPRLYTEESGGPGHFPSLCGPCVHRDAIECRHPDKMASGGPGLAIHMQQLAAIVCSRGGGCHSPVQHAVRCDGRQLPVPQPSEVAS